MSTAPASGRSFGCNRSCSGISSSRTIRFALRRVRVIAGLYLNPPRKQVMLCVEAKSQIQALERTQFVLPLGMG